MLAASHKRAIAKPRTDRVQLGRTRFRESRVCDRAMCPAVGKALGAPARVTGRAVDRRRGVPRL